MIVIERLIILSQIYYTSFANRSTSSSKPWRLLAAAAERASAKRARFSEGQQGHEPQSNLGGEVIDAPKTSGLQLLSCVHASHAT
jgi:hypothetical protein